jgi:hypothetical protein
MASSLPVLVTVDCLDGTTGSWGAIGADSLFPSRRLFDLRILVSLFILSRNGSGAQGQAGTWNGCLFGALFT